MRGQTMSRTYDGDCARHGFLELGVEVRVLLPSSAVVDWRLPHFSHENGHKLIVQICHSAELKFYSEVLSLTLYLPYFAHAVCTYTRFDP
jgi:hypothetical protein